MIDAPDTSPADAAESPAAAHAAASAMLLRRRRPEAANEAKHPEEDVESSPPTQRLTEFPPGGARVDLHDDTDREDGHAGGDRGVSSSTSAAVGAGPAREVGAGSSAGSENHDTIHVAGRKIGGHEDGHGEADNQPEDAHGVHADPERRFGGLRLIPDEHMPGYHGFNPADPLAGLYSERLRNSIERQAFLESSADTQDALIARRAGVDYVAPGKTISPLMTQLLEKVASGDVVAPSADALVSARMVALRELVPKHGPIHILAQRLEARSDHATEHHSSHGRTHRPAHESASVPAQNPGIVSAVTARPTQAEANKGRDRER